MTADRPDFETIVSAIMAGKLSGCVSIASGETSDIYDISDATGAPQILKIYARPDRQAADYKCNQDLIAYALLHADDGQAEPDLAVAINRDGPFHFSPSEQLSPQPIPPLSAAHVTSLPAWTVMPKLEMFHAGSDTVTLAKIMAYFDRLHRAVLPGLKADLRAETPFWSWDKWSNEMISLLKSHPMIGGGKFASDVNLLENLARKAEPVSATLTHGDIHPQNLYAYDGCPALFDWEELAIAPKERDYGIMLDRMHHAPTVFFDVHRVMNSSQYASTLCQFTLAFYAALGRLKRNIVTGQTETLQDFLKQVQLPDGT